MEVIKTAIDGVVIIEPRIFKDARGYFFESFSQREFEEKVRPINFVQDNESMSSYGVMRGLHFQRPPFTQSKLVRCVKGAVLDVAVDIRKGSPTYGQHVAVELTEDNHRQFFIPKGFAHGFAVLSETAVFQYKCDEFYHPEADGGISIQDDSLGIDWHIKDKAILSEKDTKIFDQEFDPNKNGEKKKLHFCIYSIEKGSYSINVNYLIEITALQRYNNIFPGNEVIGYLPENQITSYKIIDNNVNKNSNITITLKNIQGKSELYGYFCDIRKDYFCSFGSYRLNQKLDANEMLLSNHRFSSSDNSLFIQSKDNKCYLESKNNNKNCKLLAVIKCTEPENNLCAFSLLSTITDYPIMMTPKKTYYNFISTGKSDIYKIVITEPDIKSLVVVLTSNIGDAELSISIESDKEKDKSEPKLIAISNNKYSLPDVIRVTPKILNSKTLIGKYIIKIYCKFITPQNQK